MEKHTYTMLCAEKMSKMDLTSTLNSFLPGLLVFINTKYDCFHSSYGSVFKAMHKESGQVVAIKQVPVDTDLQEIIKEISMMQQCDR